MVGGVRWWVVVACLLFHFAQSHLRRLLPGRLYRVGSLAHLLSHTPHGGLAFFVSFGQPRRCFISRRTQLDVVFSISSPRIASSWPVKVLQGTYKGHRSVSAGVTSAPCSAGCTRVSSAAANLLCMFNDPIMLWQRNTLESSLVPRRGSMKMAFNKKARIARLRRSRRSKKCMGPRPVECIHSPDGSAAAAASASSDAGSYTYAARSARRSATISLVRHPSAGVSADRRTNTLRTPP